MEPRFSWRASLTSAGALAESAYLEADTNTISADHTYLKKTEPYYYTGTKTGTPRRVLIASHLVLTADFQSQLKYVLNQSI